MKLMQNIQRVDGIVTRSVFILEKLMKKMQFTFVFLHY